MNTFPLLRPLSLAIGLAALGVQAQDLALEEVVVTAQKRPQSLQEVPISVSGLNKEKN